MPSGVPSPTTPLLGRAAELQQLHALLAQERVRLVTLVGPGGSGKSRLAVELALECAASFDQIHFVDLAAIQQPDLVMSALAQSIGVQERGGYDLGGLLKDRLSVGCQLLILDTFEHLLEASTVISGLLEACRDLVVIVTSREPLSIRAEHVFFVGPLALPPHAQLADTTKLRAFPSIQLFEDRAHAARSSFRLRDDDVHVIAQLCHMLDGLPLAIELAAALVSTTSPQQIVHMLADQVALPPGGLRDLPERQRTLTATIDWSYQLLSPTEQVFFRRCGVFAGAFSAAAAAGIQPEKTEPIDALLVLSQLVRKNLLQVSAEQRDGVPRFSFLDTIHAFALDRLKDAGEVEVVRRRHAEYYVRLAEQLQATLRGSRMSESLDALSAEYGNCRAVFQWSLEKSELELGLRLAGALYVFWITRGHLAEARGWLEAALPRGGGVAAAVRALALTAAGVLAGMQHDHEQAVDFLTRSLALWTAEDDPRQQAAAALPLGMVHQNLGRLDRAAECFELAQALFARAGDPDGVARALGSRARIARARGDLAVSMRLFEQAETLFRDHGNLWGLANTLANVAQVMLRLNDRAGAQRKFCEALEMRRDTGATVHLAECLEGLADVAATDGPRLAVRLLGAAEALRKTSGAPVPVPEAEHMAELVASLREGLSEQEFETGRNEGRALSTDEAIELALSENKGRQVPAAPVETTRKLLSPRERDVAALIGQGYTNREIAERLEMSVKTVETHVKHMFVKLKVRNRTGIAVLLNRSGDL